MSYRNTLKKKTAMINHQREKEDKEELRRYYNWEEVQEVIGNTFAARAKAREIIEDYLEGNGKEGRFER